ncbi:DUF948 domain-containing protein [Bacillota bacterium Lsc_1132]
MQVILYLSVALIAIAFVVLVSYLAKALKSLSETLEKVSKTLDGLERQLNGVTNETTVLLHKTNSLADDIQKKSESLNSVVDAVKDVGATVSHFNQTLQSISQRVDKQVEQNKDKISQVIQWGNVLMDLKDKWKERKQKTAVTEHEIIASERVRARSN